MDNVIKKQPQKWHRSSVHVLIRFPCEQCKYQATVKDSLERHRRAVHDSMKYPCRQCEYQATTKESLD